MDNLNTVHAIQLPPVAIPEYWPKVREMVESITEHGNGSYTVSDVLRMLLTGRLKLWVAMQENVIEAIGLAEIIDRPQIRECRMLALTGENQKRWIHLIENVENWARSLNCAQIILIARPGWERPMKEYGYVKAHVELQKRLTSVH